MKAIVLSIMLCAALAAAAWGDWVSETIASEGDVGAGCCLAQDSWGRLHVSYVDKTNGAVMYGRYAGSSWVFETIASDVNVPGLTAIDTDAYDRPHVVFQDENAGELTYAYRSNNKWTTEAIVEGSYYGMYLSIYLWGAAPHVSYTRAMGTTSALSYAYRDDGWHTENIATGGGEFNTVFVGSDDNPHIIYWTSSDKVNHAVRDEGSWTTGEIAEGNYCNATVGPDNKIHVSFTSTDNEDLMHGVSALGDTWDIEEANGAGGKPATTRIALDSTGDVYISYYSVEEFDLHLDKKAGTSWEHEVVADGGDVGNPHSMAIDADGYPLILYYDQIGRNLYLARYDPFTGIELTSFTAKRADKGVDVRWAANDDDGAAGYNLYRAAEGAGRERVNASLISGSSPFVFHDAEAGSGVGYRYWLELVTCAGTSRTFGPASVPPTAGAHAFALYGNAPNPVAGATTFSFELAEGSDARLTVYDAAGRRVAVAADGYFGPGHHDVPFGCSLSPGVYVYRLEAGADTAARKMVVVD